MFVFVKLFVYGNLSVLVQLSVYGKRLVFSSWHHVVVSLWKLLNALRLMKLTRLTHINTFILTNKPPVLKSYKTAFIEQERY